MSGASEADIFEEKRSGCVTYVRILIQVGVDGFVVC